MLMRAQDIHKLVRRAEPDPKDAPALKGSAPPGTTPSSLVPAPARLNSSLPSPLVPIPTARIPNGRTSNPWGKSGFDQQENSEVSHSNSVRLGGEESGKQIVRRPDVNLLYDGTTPAEGVFLTNSGAIIVAPVQSYPGQRTVIHTQNVINQYAVAANPRYFPRPQEPREAGHLFVFDVMASQHTTLARAFGAGYPGIYRPGTLVEIWEWLNTRAPSRSWRVVEGRALLDAAARGLPLIALAETSSGPRLAVVEPGPPGPGGEPFLASAHEPRGQRQTPEQVFGSSTARYLAHD
ncbi:MAG: hypothetical protein JXB05_07365 [Myxococcaceae bacterium]|nr:hypothetical protein [Myxococcaceae bacterium]